MKTRETARRGVDARPVIQPLANGITSGTAKSSMPMTRSLPGFGYANNEGRNIMTS